MELNSGKLGLWLGLRVEWQLFPILWVLLGPYTQLGLGLIEMGLRLWLRERLRLGLGKYMRLAFAVWVGAGRRSGG